MNLKGKDLVAFAEFYQELHERWEKIDIGQSLVLKKTEAQSCTLYAAENDLRPLSGDGTSEDKAIILDQDIESSTTSAPPSPNLLGGDSSTEDEAEAQDQVTNLPNKGRVLIIEAPDDEEEEDFTYSQKEADTI